MLSRYRNAGGLDAGLTIEEIAKQLIGLGPADLQAIATAAKRMAFNRMPNSDQLPPLNWSDFAKATERVCGTWLDWTTSGSNSSAGALTLGHTACPQRSLHCTCL